MRRPRLGLAALGLCLAWCSGPDSDLPEAYRNVQVPEERLSSLAARETGRQLFQTHCALCHGERGDGRGARRESLSQKPSDFTDPSWRARSSPRRVYHAIREGVPGTPMPSWKALDSEQVWDLVAFVRVLGDAAGGG